MDRTGHTTSAMLNRYRRAARGHAPVHDDRAGQNVATITRAQWYELHRVGWASGREYRARTPGEPFLRIIDKIVDHLVRD